MKKRIGIVTYNKYCNFTNYGSALQSLALYKTIKSLGYECVLVDYCPEVLKDKDPLNPFQNMWVKDPEVINNSEKILLSIRENYYKFNNFYNSQMRFTKRKYDKHNFDMISEEVDSFVCGGDTIFCIEEYGFDDGYYACYTPMINNSISFSASFGDSNFVDHGIEELKKRVNNFKALGIREDRLVGLLREITNIPVMRVIDNTFLLDKKDYDCLTQDVPVIKEKYLLYYSRFYNKEMDDFVIQLSKKKKLKVIEISLRQTNTAIGHINRYDAGVEEFLSLIKNAEYVVSNSYHGVIFSIIFNKEFYCFSRLNCIDKFKQLLLLFGLSDRLIENDDYQLGNQIDYKKVNKIIKTKSKESLDYLKEELSLL